MPRRRDTLIVFTRCPEPGRTKTRLIPALGPAGAAALQTAMTRHTLAHADELRRTRGVEIDVRHAGGDARRMAHLFGRGRRYTPQANGDLGQRMADAFDAAFRAGARRAVLVGADCPQATTAVFRRAFDSLDDADIVLGPAADGGYYLIGLTRPAPDLLDGIDWSTRRVLRQTIERTRRRAMPLALLKPLHDVDRPVDLEWWRRAQTDLAPPRHEGLVSVIIPARNEEDHIGAAVDAALDSDDVEVIVVDGDSDDETVEVAQRHGAWVIRGPAGRSQQCNRGVEQAHGERLLFCHADTRLPTGYARLVRATLADPAVALGAFELGIDSESTALRRIERAVRWRSHRRKLPYGDQTLFLRRETFHRLRGFAPIQVMDDYDLVRRAARLGRITTVPVPALTSSRFWDAAGPLRATLIHQALITAYRLALPPNRLAQWRNAIIRQSL